MSRLYTLKNQSAAPRPPAVDIDFKAELNDQQYEAVTSPPGQSLVIAGAGSGKTRTLTYRVAYLIANAIAPENILLLTFTNKAAREMMERVDALLPDAAAGLWSGLFTRYVTASSASTRNTWASRADSPSWIAMTRSPS